MEAALGVKTTISTSPGGGPLSLLTQPGPSAFQQHQYPTPDLSINRTYNCNFSHLNKQNPLLTPLLPQLTFLFLPSFLTNLLNHHQSLPSISDQLVRVLHPTLQRTSMLRSLRLHSQSSSYVVPRHHVPGPHALVFLPSPWLTLLSPCQLTPRPHPACRAQSVDLELHSLPVVLPVPSVC